ncbi:unnamed protein product, partial [Mesorhabditis belari]|uniref:Endoplasmic reticulum transmembrane protein n=1 Tax=Mesorhabditis belari TaxID=2138241 RepID=A0AAF3EM07_9BILA
MSLQWTAVAGILYAEIVVVLVLLLPWIRPSLWSKFFRSTLVNVVAKNAQVGFYAGTVVLFVLFADAVREVQKYSHVDIDLANARHAEADAVLHMRLFRAQRNFYISGFALLLFLVIKRIAGLLQRGAQLEAASEAAMRQAESATKAARTLMDGSKDEDAKDLVRQVEEMSKELKKAQEDRDTLKKQAEGLQREYDRVSDLLAEAERDGKGSKKDD